MKLNRTSAIELFIELGFKTANKWDDARIQQKLDKIGDAVDESTPVESEGAKTTLAGVLEALKAGKKITLETEKSAKQEKSAKKADAPAEEPAKSKKDKAPKEAEAPAKPEKKGKEEAKPAAKAEKKPAKKEAPAKGAKAEKAVDALGSRLGSQAATINTAMSKKWQTLEEVATASGFEVSRIKIHVRYMVSKGLFEQSDKGIRLAK